MSRVKVEYNTIARTTYDKFCKANPSIKVSFRDWVKVIRSFNSQIREYIIETGHKFYLPEGFGPITIIKYKGAKSSNVNGEEKITRPIDWKKTRQVGKRVYIMNSHTDGYRFKWWWYQLESRIEGFKCWAFYPSRMASRNLAKKLKLPDSIYKEMYRESEKRRY
jgi:hypothetical protein